MKIEMRELWGALALILVCTSPRADCVLDAMAVGVPPFSSQKYLFPNWVAAPAASFLIEECEDSVCTYCTSSGIIQLTVLNYGTASGSDISGLYFSLVCGTKINSGLIPMVPAGDWIYGTETHPAWVWSGSFPFASNADPCNSPDEGCACNVSLFLYANIAPCPTDGATVQLGLPGKAVKDSCNCDAPAEFVLGTNPKEIRYITKEVDKGEVIPGDTVTYTIYLAKPGTTASQIIVVDTIPGYMHLVFGSQVPPPDPGFDPALGPPMWMRWTLPSTTVIAGGATSAIKFSASVDWGNPDWTEPESGDLAAPESARLLNRAQAFWPASSCATKTYVSQPVRSVVSRFLFWKIGNNDLLFASSPTEDDYMTYEIFIKNKSNTRTWWDVTVWDTVPEDLDSWWPGCGIDDDCVGFTMTPTGCARGGAGRVVTGASTILTWRLDLLPSATASLKWKAKLRPTVSAGTEVLNTVSLRAYGKTGVLGGTGDSQVPISFTHQASVVLRTTYFSYTSIGADNGTYEYIGFFIVFFPLNVNTMFEFRKLEYFGGAGVAGAGGKSATINNLVGNCLTGFTDPGFSIAGCGLERAPAFYWPAAYHEVPVSEPFVFLSKVSSNSPFLWMLMTELIDGDSDALTYIPATSLSCRGFMHYTVCRVDQLYLTTPGYGDRLVVINTGLDANDVFQPDLSTDVHIFRWNPGKWWDYIKTGSIDSESAWMPFEGTFGSGVHDNSIYRILSSNTASIIYQGSYTYNAPPDLGGSYDNHGGIAPNRENGNLVSGTVPATFYAVCHHEKGPNCIVGNTGVKDATYRIYQYMPYNTSVPNQNWPPTMAGASGYWAFKGTHTVGWGIDNPTNPHVYGSANGMDSTMTNSLPYATLWKIELIGGGPIQVHVGGGMYETWAGGSTIHAADGQPAGSEFWFFHAQTGGFSCLTTETYIVTTMCPKRGVRIAWDTTEHASAIYTTDGPDQAIVWMPFTSIGPASGKRAYKFYVDPGGEQAKLVAQYHQCFFDEKFLTAPFVATGVHYAIYAPAVVYSGQSFWLTVVVVGPAGGTQTDYCGETDFTSSDPEAEFGTISDSADPYQWKSGACPGNGMPYDNGVRIFINVKFRRLGVQTLVANDTVDGMITGLTAVTVVGAAVNLTKEPKLAVSSSGDTVQFRICWSNFSSATAFDLTITDAVPMGTVLVGGINTDFICGVKSDVTVDVAYSTATTLTPPATFSPASPNVLGGDTGARWLRWTVKHGGIMATGCVCFKVSVQ